MRIAVIGWGSLIWNAGIGNTKLKLREYDRAWRDDGPLLPIEYARQSGGDRLTLVIVSGQSLQRTYWAEHQEIADVGKARLNLAAREGISVSRANMDIHVACKDGSGDGSDSERPTIVAWLREKNLDVAIWTGLPAKPRSFSAIAALEYLQELVSLDAATCARDYIIKTPPQIQTKVRDLARKQFGWNDAADKFFSRFIHNE